MVTQNVDLCTGCGICAAICPQKCITMELNTDGFYIPRLADENACVNCGFCDKVCSRTVAPEQKEPLAMIAATSKSAQVLKTTSSGGVCYELAKAWIAAGKSVCGCIYDYENHRAVHVAVREMEGLEATKGSKYFQSNTADGFRQVLDGKEWIVFGTPCQMAALNKAAQRKKCRDKLLLVDFFCHGTPSMLLWDKYMGEHNGTQIDHIAFRSKAEGWHKWSLEFQYKDGSQAADSKDNMFYKFFFSNLCLNEACYHCNFKAMKSGADIRVGDFWGKKYAQNTQGVSSCVAFTEKGAEALKTVGMTCETEAATAEDVLEAQMIVSPVQHPKRKAVMKALKGKRSLCNIYNTTLFGYRLKSVIKNCLGAKR